MPARTRKVRHDDETRRRIQVSQLLNRLQNHAFGDCDMSPTQIKAAEVVLRKSLPDLAAVQVSGDEENPVRVEGGLSDLEVAQRVAFLLSKGLWTSKKS